MYIYSILLNKSNFQVLWKLRKINQKSWRRMINLGFLSLKHGIELTGHIKVFAGRMLSKQGRNLGTPDVDAREREMHLHN